MKYEVMSCAFAGVLLGACVALGSSVLVLIAGGATAISLLRPIAEAIRARRALARWQRLECRNCGYDLWGATSCICSECGATNPQADIAAILRQRDRCSGRRAWK